MPSDVLTPIPPDTAQLDEVGSPMEASSRLIMGLTLDVSASMNENGKRDQLVSTVNRWFDSVRGAEMSDLAYSLDIAAIGFSGRSIETITLGPPAALPGMADGAPFTRVKDARLPNLTCDGSTPMGAGIEKAIDVVRARRRAVVEQANLATYRPTVVVVSDGEANDAWERVIPKVRELEAAKRLLIYCVGVTGADFEILRRVAPDSTYESDVTFETLAVMLSASAASGATAASAKDVYDRVADAVAKLGVERKTE